MHTCKSIAILLLGSALPMVAQTNVTAPSAYNTPAILTIPPRQPSGKTDLTITRDGKSVISVTNAVSSLND